MYPGSFFYILLYSQTCVQRRLTLGTQKSGRCLKCGCSTKVGGQFCSSISLMKIQAGRCWQVVAVQRWLLTQVWLYIIIWILFLFSVIQNSITFWTSILVAVKAFRGNTLARCSIIFWLWIVAFSQFSLFSSATSFWAIWVFSPITPISI